MRCLNKRGRKTHNNYPSKFKAQIERTIGFWGLRYGILDVAF